MSTHEEIMDVFYGDIDEKTRLVEATFGKTPFYDGFRGFTFCSVYDENRISKIKCADYAPVRRKWSRKYGKPSSGGV